MHLKLHFNALLIICSLFTGCSGDRVVSTGTINPHEFCVVQVDEVSSEKVFDAIMWDMNRPLWRATLSLENASNTQSLKKSFVLRYQALPSFGQFVVGQKFEVTRFECDRLVIQKIANLSDWSEGWIRPIGK